MANRVYAAAASATPHAYDGQYDQATVPGATSDPTAVVEAARARFFQQGQQVLAEQKAGSKPGERDRSPVRRTAPLLPDPSPTSFPQSRPKRRALLPTPPGGPEDPAADGDPIAR